MEKLTMSTAIFNRYVNLPGSNYLISWLGVSKWGHTPNMHEHRTSLSLYIYVYLYTNFDGKKYDGP